MEAKKVRKNKLAIRIGGAAGTGVKSVGKLIQKYLQELGFFTFGYLGYPSLIRGGYNFYQIDFSYQPLASSQSNADIFIPLDKQALSKAENSLNKDSLILADTNIISQEKNKYSSLSLEIAPALKKEKIPKIMINTALIGVLAHFLDYPLEALEKTIKKVYKDKNKVIIEDNLKATKVGYYLPIKKSQYKEKINLPLPKRKEKTVALSGNEAIALGFIAGGGKFYTAYPMTPSTNILHFLVKVEKKKKIVVRQASTEIEAIGSALGASYAGVRSMVATSGGGIDLMSEFISLAGISEIPILIVDAQRTGPATGLPTWQEQADLNIARYTGHGEFPRAVLAPGDIGEAFKLTQEGLNLADKYQIPVILLSDKHLSESVYSDYLQTFIRNKIKIERGKIIKQIDKEYFLYPRYSLKETISGRPLPGTKNGLYVANSDEHNEYGQSIESEPMRTKMQAKRMAKLELLRKELPLPNLYGQQKSKTLLIGWGSSKGSILAAQKYYQQRGIKLDYAHFTHLYPLDYQRLENFFKNYSNFIIIENNSTSQLKTDIRLSGVKEEQIKTILKYDGEPFFEDELIEKINKLIAN